MKLLHVMELGYSFSLEQLGIHCIKGKEKKNEADITMTACVGGKQIIHSFKIKCYFANLIRSHFKNK